MSNSRYFSRYFSYTLCSSLDMRGSIFLAAHFIPRRYLERAASYAISRTEAISLKGPFVLSCTLRNCRLIPGPYSLMLILNSDQGATDKIDDIAWEVTPTDVYGTGKVLPDRTGAFLPETEWQIRP